MARPLVRARERGHLHAAVRVVVLQRASDQHHRGVIFEETTRRPTRRSAALFHTEQSTVVAINSPDRATLLAASRGTHTRLAALA